MHLLWITTFTLIIQLSQSYLWNTLPSLPTDLGFICGGIYNNTINILGGYDDIGLQQNEYSTTVHYDSSTNIISLSNWTVNSISATFPSIPELGSDTQQYVTVGDLLYIMGTDDRIFLEDAPGKLVIYNLKTKSFMDMTTYSSQMNNGLQDVFRSGNCITTDQTKIYSIGGHDSFGAATTDFIQYDIENDEWSNGVSINYARYSVQCVYVRNKLYVIGGGSHEAASVLNMEMFNLNDFKPWEVEEIPGVITSSFAYNINSNGIYLSGGANSVSYGTAVSTSYFYDIDNKTWSVKNSMLTASYGFASMLYQPDPEWMFIIHIGGVVRLTSCGLFCVNKVYTSVSQYTRIKSYNTSFIDSTISTSSTPSQTPVFDPDSTASNKPTTILYVSSFLESTTLTNPEIRINNGWLNNFVFGHLFYIIIIVGAIDFMVFVCCICYIFTGLRKRAKEPQNSSWVDAIKEFRCAQYFGIIVELFDVSTDYLFATGLIVTKSDNILLVALGWTSLIIAIFGVILFLCKYHLLKKLLGVQIKQYRKELQLTINQERRNELMKQIRIRKIDIDVLSLLNSSVEDLPQTMIILVYLSNFGFSDISVISISISILSFLFKLFTILMTSFGCNDVEDKVSHKRVLTRESIAYI